MRARGVLVPLFLGLFLAVPGMASPARQDIYLIDTHSQVEDGEVRAVVQVMDQGGVYRTVLSAIGTLSPTTVVDLGQQYPGRIIPAVTTKGFDYTTGNISAYNARLASQINSGRFAAMAEVLIYHALKASGAGEKIAPPGDQRVQTALRYAVARGWPFIMHIEFAAIPFAEERERLMREFEAMVVAHSDHPFVLIHMGQLPAAEVRRLIEAHPNVYFQTSATTPGLAQRSGQPWINLFVGGILAPEWKRLFTQYPDRFVFALDAIGDAFLRPENYYLRSVRLWRNALADLPDGVAQAVAHGNAERLWKLPAKGP